MFHRDQHAASRGISRAALGALLLTTLTACLPPAPAAAEPQGRSSAPSAPPPSTPAAEDLPPNPTAAAPSTAEEPLPDRAALPADAPSLGDLDVLTNRTLEVLRAGPRPPVQIPPQRKDG
jgi:hypothetical protein